MIKYFDFNMTKDALELKSYAAGTAVNFDKWHGHCLNR